MRVAGQVGEYTISVTDKLDHVVIEHVDGGRQALRASQVGTVMGLLRQAAAIAGDATTPHTTGMVGNFTAAVGEQSTVVVKCAGAPLFDLASDEADAVADVMCSVEGLMTGDGRRASSVARPCSAVTAATRPSSPAPAAADEPDAERPKPRPAGGASPLSDAVASCVTALRAGAAR